MKILLTTDGSTQAHHAIEEAIRLLPLATSEVHVIATADPLPPIAGYYAMGAGDAKLLVDEAIARVCANLDAAKILLDAHGLTAIYVEREEDPVRGILAYAEAFQPDLVVMGSHGRNALGRLVLGSVAEQVLHAWHGSVLVVRAAPHQVAP